MNPNDAAETLARLQSKVAELEAEVVRLKAENKELKQYLYEAEEAEPDDVIEWDEKSQRIIADRKWAHQQEWLGTFAPYADQHVGICEQQVVGHNENLDQLRIDVEREHGIRPDRLVTLYIFGPKGLRRPEITGPAWRPDPPATRPS